MKRYALRLAAAAAATLALCAAGTASRAEDAAKPAPAAEAPKADAAKPAETPKPAEAAKPVDAPFAVVNGVVIPSSEFDRAFGAYVTAAQQSGAGLASNFEAMRDEVVNQVVDRELLYQESKKFPLKDLDQKVEGELKEIRARFPSPEAFEEALKGQQLSLANLKELLGRQVSVRNYVETQIEPTVKVPEAEVKKFYEENKARFVEPEQVRASHILVLMPEGAKAGDEAYKKAKAKAEELQKKAAAGDDFAKLAQENSEDPGSKDQGGDLGFFTKDRMVQPFADAAFALKPAEVSGVVETQFGFHVIKLTERQDAVQHGYDEVKGDIEAYLKAQALDGAVRAKLAELRKVAKVELPGVKK